MGTGFQSIRFFPPSARRCSEETFAVHLKQLIFQVKNKKNCIECRDTAADNFCADCVCEVRALAGASPRAGRPGKARTLGWLPRLPDLPETSGLHRQNRYLPDQEERKLDADLDKLLTMGSLLDFIF